MKDNLEAILKNLDQALKTLDYSIVTCNEIGIKQNYTNLELTAFEALTSRFARVTDIVTQKLLKTIFIIIREDCYTFLDRINLAEKLDIITSSNDLKILRDLRNSIAHEYLLEDITSIFRDVLNKAPLLILNINKIKAYVLEKKLSIN